MTQEKPQEQLPLPSLQSKEVILRNRRHRKDTHPSPVEAKYSGSFPSAEAQSSQWYRYDELTVSVCVCNPRAVPLEAQQKSSNAFSMLPSFISVTAILLISIADRLFISLRVRVHRQRIAQLRILHNERLFGGL